MPTVTEPVTRKKLTTKPNYSYFNWSTTAIMMLLHVGAVAALFMFSWKALIISAVLYWVCIGFGIGMGYHRLHTHRSYKVPEVFGIFLCGVWNIDVGGRPDFLGGDSSHSSPDIQTMDGDPHSPQHGGFWAHMGWIIFGEAEA